MKLITNTIILICVLSSCGDVVERKLDELSNLPEPSIDSTLRIGDYKFVVAHRDSTYANYWCSTMILTETQKRIDDLDLKTTANFLATFSSVCESNSKYSEWSNELLFEVCTMKPELVHQLLSKNSSLDRNRIIEQLESPIHDGIDLDRVLEGFQNLEQLELEGSES